MLGRLWRKGEKHPALLVGIQIDAAHMENSVETPLKLRLELPCGGYMWDTYMGCMSHSWACIQKK